MKSRAQLAVVSQINAAGGSKCLAAASICTIGKTFVSDELKEDVSYLYVYENAAPIMVTFTSGEDNTVSATGSYIFYDEFNVDSKEDVEQFFEELSAKVEQIK